MMNRIRILLFLALSVVMTSAWAESINENQARSIAADFMARHSVPSSTLKIAKKAPRINAPGMSDKAAYYVFNASRGYVIVAGDDRVPAVLGYSDLGTFDEQDVPEAMQYLLEGYAAQIEALDEGAKAAPHFTSGEAISPLVTSTWSQNAPYYVFTPFVNGKHTPAGCVATAMAQVMYYWKWPARPTMTIPEYTTSTLGITRPALEPVDFGWDVMQDSYLNSDSTSAAGLAAATLTLYCGQSVEMNYNEGGSGAKTTRLPWMLSTYFGYKSSAHCLSRDNYTSQEWADAIYNELSAGRPVIYSGSKKSSGHAFICDGYDGNGLFHINWGWNGKSNGYFLLNVLNPDIQGTGSASGAYGYIYSQAIVVGIEPGDDASEFAYTSTDVSLDDYTTSRTASNYSFKATVSGRFRNNTSQVFAVSFGWGLYQGETLKSVLYETYASTSRPGYYYTISGKVLSFGSGITSGTYRIVPIYSEYSTGNWRPCIGADKNYIEVTINGNNCTYTGFGTAGEDDYTINDITYEGLLHNGRPVDITVDITNNGNSQNRLLYMHVDGTFTSTGYLGMGKGERALIPFRYLPTTAGTYTLTFSLNEDGSDPIATRTLTISTMPEATLSATAEVLNITDSGNKIVTSDKFSVKLTITNEGTTTYNEEISMKLYKNIYDNTGSSIQAKSQVITLEPGATTVVQFDMDNVIDGWRYFGSSNYYSAGAEVPLVKTSFYTIIFPEAPQLQMGDVNGDGLLNITDVTLLTNYLVGGTDTQLHEEVADINQDGELNVTDVILLINIIINQVSMP